MRDDRRYWVEEVKQETNSFVDRSDVFDYDVLFYIIHDRYAYEDYPVMITPNLVLATGMCDRLNEYEDVLDEQDKIMKENGLELVDRDYTFKCR